MHYSELRLPADQETTLRSYKTFGAEWTDRAIDHAKAVLYLETYCLVLSRDSKKLGPCYDIGSTTYARLDGQPLTADDFAALRRLNWGQVNRVTGNIGDLRAVHSWECDSGD